MRPEHSVAEVSTGDGHRVGLAFLVDGRRLVTCAHVVNSALGRGRKEPGHPGADAVVRVRFPFVSPNTVYEAGVARWFPSGAWDPVRDLVTLRMSGALPAGVPALAVARAAAGPGVVPVQMCGPAKDGGLDHVLGRLVGDRAPGRRQIDQERFGAYRVRRGFSGGPVWRQDTGEVVGVMRAANPDEDVSAAECLDLAAIRGGADDGRVEVLQLGGLRFGADGSAVDEWDRVLGELAELRDGQDVAPNLVTVCGNLSAHASLSEFRAAREFLDRVAAELSIGPERVITVPGPADVNLALCRSYFDSCEALEEKPVAPYWEKWRPYSMFLEGLHGEALPRDMPWRTYKFEELKTVVVALNSTYAYSHREKEQYGAVTERQLQWFAERLVEPKFQGWHRIAVTHHSPLRNDRDGILEMRQFRELLGPGLDVVLAGSIDAVHKRLSGSSGPPVLGVASADGPRFRVLRFGDGELTTWDGPGEPSTLVLSTGSSTRDDPAPVRRSRHATEPINRVFAACELREPGARIEPVYVDDEQGISYVHVVTRHDFGRDRLEATGEYVVGVHPGSVREEDVRRFKRQVVDRFRSPGAVFASTLVYFGDLASAEVVEFGRERGIAVVSFARFQLDWDPRRFVDWQREDLDRDPRYPPKLYIAQRYREIGPSGQWIDSYGRTTDRPRDDLVHKVAQWMGEPEGHLVVVLGAAGAGKTFFLRTLARRLSTTDIPVTPVYLPLRELERIPELDEVLAARLTRAGEHRLPIDKFNYFLAEGRIALLLDGLDELTVQSTYDKAIGYLEAIGAKARDKAKVVVTARDVEFLSNREVLRALGGAGAVTQGRRALRVEGFSDQQIREFLTRWLDGDKAATERRIRLLGGVVGLPEVARNPRMLSFIATIPEKRLKAAWRAGSGIVTAAELYREVLDEWMRTEEKRLSRPGQSPALSRDELWHAISTLAMHLWRTDRERVTLEDLGHAASTLEQLDPDGVLAPASDPRVHQLGAGSLLIRYDDGELGFVHRSIQEWLVAKTIVDDPNAVSHLERRRLSAQAAMFLAQMDQPAGLLDWAENVQSSGGGYSPAAASNAGYISQAPPTPSTHSVVPRSVRNFAGRDMRGQDLSSEFLVGADLTGGKFQRVVFDGNDLSDATAMSADFREAHLSGVTARRTDFSRADLTGARLLGADLTDAILDEAVLDRAALIGAEVDPWRLEAAKSHLGTALPRAAVSPQFQPPRVGHVIAGLPSGPLVVTGDDQGWLRLWDLDARAAVRSWRAYARRIDALACSPDLGTRVVAVAGENVGCWDTATGDLVWQKSTGSLRIAALAWSRDGSVAACTEDGELVRLDHQTLTVQARWAHDHPIRALAWEPHGPRLACGDSTGVVRILAEGEVKVQPSPKSPIIDLAWSPDDEWILALTGQGLRVLDGQATWPLEADLEGATSIDWTPGSRPIAVADVPGTIGSLDLENDQMHVEIRDERRWVRAACWTPSGDQIVSGDVKGEQNLWDVDGGRRIARVSIGRSSVLSVDVSSDGESIAAGIGAEVVHVWNRSTGETQADVPCGSVVNAVTWSPLRRLLAAGTRDRRVKIWSQDDATITDEWDLGGSVRGLVWSPDGESLYACGHNGALAKYRPGRSEAVWWQLGSEVPMWTLGLSPDGSTLLVGDVNGMVSLASAGQGELIHPGGTAHNGTVTSVSWSPGQSNTFATAGSDGYVCVWIDSLLVRKWTAHAGWTTSVSYSPDGTRLLTSGNDGVLRIWDAATYRLQTTLVALPDSGDAALFGDGLTYRCDGDPQGGFWFAAAHCRFEPGELDEYVPEITRLPN